MKKILLWFFFLYALVAFGQEFQFTPITVSGTPALVGITDITGSGEGVSEKLYIVEKRGVIRIVQNNAIAAQQFLSIENLVEEDGERGLLGLAFHPDFPVSRYFYVNYVIQGTITTRISRFTVPVGSPGNADEASELILLEFAGLETNHKAGDIAFGPDGFLYITTGDGGGGGDPGDNGQDNNEWLGKILRINVDVSSGGLNYSNPPTNPFVGVPGLDEIFMIGLRNPWRMSFDRETGDLWIADVGQGLWEEVNRIPAGTGAGRNLGWNCKEGFHNYEPQHCDVNDILTSPIMEYRHCPDGTNQCGASITGGFVYRGNDYPDMYGKYIAVDFSSNDIWEILFPDSLSYESNGNSGITTFGEDDFGELFAGNLAGVLYRVTMGQPLAIQWESLVAIPINNGNRISWTLHDFLNVDYFEVQRSSASGFNDFVKLVNITPDPDEVSYSYDDPYIHTDGVYYRIGAYINDGSIEYSPVARILPDPLSKPSLTFDFNTNMWRIAVPANWQTGDLTLYDLQGRVVYTTQMNDRDHVDLSKPVPPGVYFISIRSIEGTWSDRIVR